MTTSNLLRISLITITPTARPPSARILGLAPYVLQSYASNRLKQEGIFGVDFQTHHFVEGADPKEIARQVLAVKPDWVALSAYVWNFSELIQVAEIIRSQSSKIQIIMGGPEASPQANEIMNLHTCLDAIPYSNTDGEVVFYSLIRTVLKRLPLSEAPGLVYRDNQGRLQRTQPPQERLDLNQSPSPYLDGSIQLDANTEYRITIEISRGCSLDCSYCFWGGNTDKVRFFPLERILGEIDFVFSQPQVSSVFFSDADFLINSKRSIIILRRIEARLAERQTAMDKLSFEVNATSIRESARESLQCLARLPGHFFTFAIQTVNLPALALLGRHRPTPDVYIRKSALLRELAPGSAIYADIMLPLPGDNLDGLRMTLDFALNLKVDRIVVNYPVYLLPGTAFFQQWKELGIVRTAVPPYAVVETDSFPKVDVARAYRLALWVELFVVYYPEIFHAAVALHEIQPTYRLIDLLESWMEEIEVRTPVISPLMAGLVDVSLESLTSRNRLKAAVLGKACETAVARVVYDVAYTNCSQAFNTDKELATLALGRALFSILDARKVDCLDQSKMNAVLPGLAIEAFPNHTNAELRAILPRFKRVNPRVVDQEAVRQKAALCMDPLIIDARFDDQHAPRRQDDQN